MIKKCLTGLEASILSYLAMCGDSNFQIEIELGKKLLEEEKEDDSKNVNNEISSEKTNPNN